MRSRKNELISIIIGWCILISVIIYGVYRISKLPINITEIDVFLFMQKLRDFTPIIIGIVWSLIIIIFTAAITRFRTKRRERKYFESNMDDETKKIINDLKEERILLINKNADLTKKFGKLLLKQKEHERRIKSIAVITEGKEI